MNSQIHPYLQEAHYLFDDRAEAGKRRARQGEAALALILKAIFPGTGKNPDSDSTPVYSSC